MQALRTHLVANTIAADRDKVWALLTTVERIPLWYDEWERATSDGGPRLAAGDTLELERPTDPVNGSVTCRVQDVDRPNRFSWIESGGPDGPVAVEFVLSDGTDDSTVVALRKEWL